jgi:soluble lytic murein transglycosylase-like protein
MLLPIGLAVAGIGFAAALYKGLQRSRSASGATISYEPPAPTSSGGGYMPNVSIPSWLTPQILASAKKWAAARGVPLREILATIYVESRGKPRAWANLSTEDSRGLMQVNVNAWGSKLKSYGMTVDDLWDIDKNIMVGSDIYANYRKTVQNLIAQSGVPQAAPIDVLTRLYYKGPKYVREKILAGKDASLPYKNAAAAVENWKVAMAMVDPVSSVA